MAMNSNKILKIQIFLFLTVFSSALAMKQSPEPFHDIFPNEVVRMFFEHMKSRQRFSVSRVSMLWRFLTASFNDVPKLEAYPDEDSTDLYSQSDMIGLKTHIDSQDHTPIHLLIIDKNGLSPEEHAQIMTFACSPKVVELNLFDKRLGANQLAALSDNYNLMCLALCSIPFDQPMLNAVTDLICQLPNLKKLRLLSNSLGANKLDLTSFGEAIAQSTCLQELSITGDCLTDVQKKALVAALKTNKSIEYLHLTNSNIEDEGAKELSDVIRLNNQLKQLWLQRNGITDNGAQTLCKALEQNTTLTGIVLQDGNDAIRPETLASIYALVSKNSQKIIDPNITGRL
jgi:hypothetical protein